MRSKKKHPYSYDYQPMVFGVLLLMVMAMVATGTLFFTHWQDELVHPVDSVETEGGILIQQLDYPDWFLNSSLNLAKDLETAQNNGKKGLIIYFGRESCACCEVMMQVNLHDTAIASYLQDSFEIIAIDAMGENLVSTFAGDVMPEARFAREHQADATPSMLFYDLQGNLMFHLLGYQPPYEFRAALDYVISGEYRNITFNQYLSQLERPALFSEFDLHTHDLFIRPPYLLDRSQHAGERPLAVFFETGNCPGCDLLHNRLLSTPAIVDELRKMDVVQLDITENTPVVTPSGLATTAAAWAEELGVHYAPTLVFFSRNGSKISSIASIAQWGHLPRYLKYVVNGVYRNPNQAE